MKIFLFALLFLIIIKNVESKIIYTNPVNNAKLVSIYDNVIISFEKQIINNKSDISIKVIGSKSGIHSGEILITEDGKSITFKTHPPFMFDESVEVSLKNVVTEGSEKNQMKFTFHTQAARPVWNKDESIIKEYGNNSDNYYGFTGNYSVLPQLNVLISNNPSPGKIFLNNYQNSPVTSHIIIANNDGTYEYSREFNPRVEDFSKQPNGMMTYFNYSLNKYYAENSQFNIVDSFYCGNGYSTDGHELRLLSNGHALLMSYDPQFVNMSQIVPGGNPNAIVIGLIIQEIDKNKIVVFQWRSWDHFQITDAQNVNLLASTVDYVHGNAIEKDFDNNILISSRHLNEITKINRKTGDIMWRLGGANNQFAFLNDTLRFRYQHYIRRLPNKNITLFDNGNFRQPLFSRAIEYKLDEEHKTAKLIWQYRSSPDIYGAFMGSVQRLRNGNTLIGWGGTNPTLTEVTPSGTIALQMSYPTNIWSYRAFKDETTLTINLNVVIEGYYNFINGRLSSNDTVSMYLHNSYSPFNVIDSAQAVIDSVNLNGSFRFYNAASGSYYISVHHRNSIETWSRAGGETYTTGGVYDYDFTNSISKAYGNNLILKGSKYCIYSGDVNDDAVVDASDVIVIYNDIQNSAFGYINSDVSGDGTTDVEDLLIAYNNVIRLAVKVTP